MKILQTESERKSFIITVLLFLLMLLLFIFYKISYKVEESPIMGGEIAINFGTSDLGKGEVQPEEEVEMSPVLEEVVKLEVETVAETPVITQNVISTPVVKKAVEKPKVNKDVPKPMEKKEEIK